MLKLSVDFKECYDTMSLQIRKIYGTKMLLSRDLLFPKVLKKKYF